MTFLRIPLRPDRGLLGFLGLSLVGLALAASGASAAGSSAAGSGGVPAAAPTPLAGADYFGANIQPLIRETFVPPSGWNALIADMSEDSLPTARIDAPWSWAEPNAPSNGVHSYTWNPPNTDASLDRLVKLLASNHVRMLAVLSLPPAWAGDKSHPLTPAHYQDYVAFAQAFAARYGDNGSFWKENPQLPYEPVRQLEVWTEANSANFWTGHADPAEYMKVLKPLDSAVHAVDPGGQVLASIGWQDEVSYVSSLYKLGLKGSVDAIGFHPYSPDTPGILSLTQQLRGVMAAAGDANLPIYLTETGQPAAPSGPGADHAYNGPVSDSARAATLSLTGDALARSDCGVQSFDVYSLVSSGTNAEPIQEGYMGILNYKTGQPNATGAALIAASRRWQAQPSDGLVLCRPGSTAPPSLLPLGLALSHTSPTCVSAVVTYYGNPIEAAQLVLQTPDGRVDPASTNAFGQTQMCLQDGPPVDRFTVDSELSSPTTFASLTSPDVAESAIYSCPVSSAVCTEISDPRQPAGQPTPPAPAVGVSAATVYSGQPASTTRALATKAAKPRCRLSIQVLKIAGTRTTLRARLTCPGAKQPTALMRAWLKRHGHSKLKFLARIKLAKGHWHKFTVQVAIHVGDRLSVIVPASKSAQLAALRSNLTATKKLLRHVTVKIAHH